MNITANIPPAVLGLRVKRAPTLWLPLFLLWPLLLLALLLLFVAARHARRCRRRHAAVPRLDPLTDHRGGSPP